MSGRYSRKNNDGVRAKRSDDDDDDDHGYGYGDAMRRCGSQLGAARLDRVPSTEVTDALTRQSARTSSAMRRPPLVRCRTPGCACVLFHAKSVCSYAWRAHWRRSWELTKVFTHTMTTPCDRLDV